MENVRKILEEQRVPFDIIRHKQPIRTAKEGAQALGIDIGQTAPALVLKADGEYVVLIISGARGRIDLEALAGMLGRGKLELASRLEAREATGYEAGAIPLAGHAMPCLVDKLLYRYPWIYGGTGEPATTLKLDPRDLSKVNHVVAYLEADRA
ncbi:MAG: YbaK/EbsC family protein [Paenibacillus dendritiformis]|uniref:aminoacyl-tRNA deacylase n=1 Tax=uncultured Paenibacillus sp. TaxID=227322 RepID=UPI0025F3AE95|nr:YbaK/EbsC family protein [uncultured Paenibacillus sp.]MDU5140786.1 YbaK/EbsC family protein [Paenibacillus dendritiformis]